MADDRLTAAGIAMVTFITVLMRACINSGALSRFDAVEMLIILRDRLVADLGALEASESFWTELERRRLAHLIVEIEAVLEPYRAPPTPGEGID